MSNVVPLELGTEKIPKLLKKYAVPAIIAMTASSLYNMCDSIFIGQGVGAYAIAGLALTFPLMNLSVAFGTLVGVGASTLMSVLLGQKNYKATSDVLGNSVVLNIICGLVFSVLALSFLDDILAFFGGSENTIPYAREYMSIILFGNVITHLYFGLNNVVRVLGFPKKAMGATVFTVVINAILDPVFIFVFRWGIAGAAIATVIAQFLAMLYVFKVVSNREMVVHLKRGIFGLKKKIIKQILSIGMAPFLMNACACVIVIFFNQQLQRYGGDMAIGAYGIVNRLGFIVVMIVFGFNQGMQPIVGYNFGARNVTRVRDVLRLTIMCATITTTAGFAVAMLFPRQLSGIFTTDPELLDKCTSAMRIFFCTFPIIGFQIVATNFFQSIGFVKKAIFLSLTRQAIFILPLIFVLPLFMGIDGVWWSLPASDLLASILTWYMLRRQIAEFKRHDAEEVGEAAADTAQQTLPQKDVNKTTE